MKTPISLLFTSFLSAFLQHYGVLPTQVYPNAHRILAYFHQICARHNIPCTLESFASCYRSGHSTKTRSVTSPIFSIIIRVGNTNSPPSPKRLEFIIPATLYSAPTLTLTAHAEAIFTKFYDYRIFKTPKDYAAANLQEPRYDLEKKYILETKTVTITVLALGSYCLP